MIGGRHIGGRFARHVVGIVGSHVGGKKGVVDAKALIKNDESIYRARAVHVGDFFVNEIPTRLPARPNPRVHGDAAARRCSHKTRLGAFPRVAGAFIYLHVATEVAVQRHSF